MKRRVTKCRVRLQAINQSDRFHGIDSYSTGIEHEGMERMEERVSEGIAAFASEDENRQIEELHSTWQKLCGERGNLRDGWSQS